MPFPLGHEGEELMVLW